MGKYGTLPSVLVGIRVRRLSWLLGTAAVASVLVAASAARAFTWMPATLADQGHGQAVAANQDLKLVSCPSEQLCVAIDSQGAVLASTAPLSSTGSWRLVALLPSGVGTGASALDCPSSQLCVLATGYGDVWSTTNPTAAKVSWNHAHVSGDPLVALSCPSAAFCAVAASHRSVYTSGNPAGGPGSWRQIRFPKRALRPFAWLSGISCASKRFCLAIAGGGVVLSSRNPTGPARAWRRVVLRKHPGLSAPACPTARLCLMFDDGAHGGYKELWSSNPSGAARAWHQGIVDRYAADGVSSLSCASPRLCVGLLDSGAVVSSSPTRASSWRTTSAPAAGVKVSCGSPRFCAAVAGRENVLTTATPTAVKASWRSIGIDAGGPSITGVSCPAAQLCVGVDELGTVLTSTMPASWGLWAPQATDTVAGLTAVSCGGVSLCVAIDGAGAFSSANPTGGPAAWSRAAIDPGHTLTAVACPSAQLCVATDDAGRALSTTTPTGGTGAWAAAKIDNSALTGISCSSPSLCVAAGAGRRVLASTNPSGGASAWRVVATDRNAPNPYAGGSMTVACSPQGLCVAGDENGGLLSSTSPANGSWRFAEIDPNTGPDVEVTYFPLVSASCPSNQLCAVIDNDTQGVGGDALVSSDPTNGASWSNNSIGFTALVNAVSCPSTQLCVAVDGSGQAIIGTGT
jgi:hypothetical protein